MRKEIINNLRSFNFLSFKEIFFICPYMIARVLSMLINLWLLAYLINNYQFSTFAISRFIAYGFIVDFLRNIYLISYSGIPIKLRDEFQIFNSNNFILVIIGSGFCSYFGYSYTNSIIFSTFIFIITFLLSFDIDVIRGNDNKQPINQYLFLSGLFISLVLVIFFKNKNDLIAPFLVLVFPFITTAFYNLLFLLKRINLLKRKGFSGLNLKNFYTLDYRLLLIGIFPGFILNMPLILISRSSPILLDLSLIIRTYNLFVSILPIINNLTLKRFFNRNKKFLFNNERFFLVMSQISMGSIVGFFGLIFLNLFLDKNISINLYFYALSLFVSFSIFHSGVILPNKINDFIPNKIKIFYFLFVCILFYIIGKNIILISINPIIYLVLLQSLILSLSYKFIVKR